MTRRFTSPKANTRFCWECSRRLMAGGRAWALVVGEDGHEHAVHKNQQCIQGRTVLAEST